MSKWRCERCAQGAGQYRNEWSVQVTGERPSAGDVEVGEFDGEWEWSVTLCDECVARADHVTWALSRALLKASTELADKLG